MLLDDVIQFAVTAHTGQVDKSGAPYIGHPERVAEKVRQAGGSQVLIAAAWLHDVLEDTGATAEGLQTALDLDDGVIDIVVALTKRPRESNQDYAARIAGAGAGAVLVKMCDLHDNLDPARVAHLDRTTRTRLMSKYGRTLLSLADAMDAIWDKTGRSAI